MARNKNKALTEFIKAHNLVAFSTCDCDSCDNCRCFYTAQIGYKNFSPANGKIKNKLRRLLGASENEPIDVKFLITSGYLEHVRKCK